MKSKLAISFWRMMTTACVVLSCLHPCQAGQKQTVGADVPPAQRVAIGLIDHSSWDQLLQQYVDIDGNVDYSGWKANQGDVRVLDDYLTHLSSADLKAVGDQGAADRDAQLAFWINAYNAVTVAGILQKYPTTSIRNHTAKIFGYNIWHDLLLNVSGKPYSLDQIEHKVLRTMGEPRIHFAIVCASRSCPRLLAEAYTAEKLDDQLASNTKAFFAHRRNFRFDEGHQSFQLSSILDWFGSDFGSDKATVLRALSKYMPSSEANKAALAGNVSVSYLKYDWSLNSQATSNSGE